MSENTSLHIFTSLKYIAVFGPTASSKELRKVKANRGREMDFGCFENRTEFYFRLFVDGDVDVFSWTLGVDCGVGELGAVLDRYKEAGNFSRLTF